MAKGRRMAPRVETLDPNLTLLTTDEVAELLLMSPDGLRRAVHLGQVPAHRFGRKIRYVRSEIEAFIKNLPSAMLPIGTNGAEKDPDESEGHLEVMS